MIIDITNEIITKLKNSLSGSGVDISKAFSGKVPKLPLVVVQEVQNDNVELYSDSSGDNISSISIQIDIFTEGNTRETDAKKIRNNIDSILSDEMRFNRIYTAPTPNEDINIYRYTIRYNALIGKEKVIYRR